MLAIAPLLGDWAYGLIVLAPIAVGAFARPTARRRIINRWDRWCLTPQPRDAVARHARRPPTPRGTR